MHNLRRAVGSGSSSALELFPVYSFKQLFWRTSMVPGAYPEVGSVVQSNSTHIDKNFIFMGKILTLYLILLFHKSIFLPVNVYKIAM